MSNLDLKNPDLFVIAGKKEGGRWISRELARWYSLIGIQFHSSFFSVFRSSVTRRGGGGEFIFPEWRKNGCKIRWSFSIISWIVEITGRGVGEGRLLFFFFFLIRRENSFHVLLPFFVAVYRCSLQSHDHEFNRARWLAQSSFPGCLPEERLFNNWNTRKKQLLPKLHRATVPFHRSRAVEDFRDEIHRVIKTDSPVLRYLFYLLDRFAFTCYFLIKVKSGRCEKSCEALKRSQRHGYSHGCLSSNNHRLVGRKRAESRWKSAAFILEWRHCWIGAGVSRTSKCFHRRLRALSRCTSRRFWPCCQQPCSTCSITIPPLLLSLSSSTLSRFLIETKKTVSCFSRILRRYFLSFFFSFLSLGIQRGTMDGLSIEIQSFDAI